MSKYQEGNKVIIARILDDMTSKEIIGTVSTIDEIDPLANGHFNYYLKSGHYVHEEELLPAYFPQERPSPTDHYNVCLICNSDPEICDYNRRLAKQGHANDIELLRSGCVWCIRWQPARMEVVPMNEVNPANDYFTCPSNHTFPHDRFHSYVKLDVEDLDLAIIFDCPGGKRGHQFNLRQAVAAGMFDIEQAARIRETGRLHRQAFQESEDRIKEGQARHGR